jgi:DNA-binding transcriptional regulator YiaG
MKKGKFKRENVKPLRESLQLTQRELANILGATIFAISSWENPRNTDKSIRIAYSRKLWDLADKNGIKF